MPVPRMPQCAVDWPDSPGRRVMCSPSTSGAHPHTRWTQKVWVEPLLFLHSAQPVYSSLLWTPVSHAKPGGAAADAAAPAAVAAGRVSAAASANVTLARTTVRTRGEDDC